MPAKRTTLPPELMAEWADERAVGEVPCKAKAEWQCAKCQHKWMTTITHRLQGNGCPRRCDAVKGSLGAFRKHPDFNLIAQYVPEGAKIHDRISPPCSAGCNKTYVVSIKNYLQGCRQHHNCAKPRRIDWQLPLGLVCLDPKKYIAAHSRVSLPFRCPEGHTFDSCKGNLHKAALNGTVGCFRCAHPKRADWQLPPGVVCLDPVRYAEVNGTTTLPFRCPEGHTFVSRKADLNTASLAGTTGCPHCAGNAPISSRLAVEAPDILAVGAVSSPASAVAILSALGKTSTKEIAAYKRMLEMQQGGMSASEAIAEMTKRGDDSLDADDVDSDIGGSSDLVPDLDAPQLDAWNRQRVDNLFDALDKVDHLFADGTISDETAYQFLVDEQVATLWNVYCDLESAASTKTSSTTPTALNITTFVAKVREQASSMSRLLSTVAQTFLRQHDGAAALHVPVGFKPRGGDNKPLMLRMMQRLIAWHLTEGGRRCFGNWSAPGAGKTLAALLTARLVQSRLTVVICPNNVIPTWQAQIDRTYNHGKRINVVAEIQTWQPHDDADFLILNYDRLQGADAEAQALKFCAEYGNRIGLVVIDECHRVKNDGQIGQQGSGGKAGPSSRRRVLDAIVKALPKSKLLIQTGTPVLTGCAEGVSLIDLLDETAQKTYGFTRKNSFSECMRLHQAMTRYGVRFKPRVGVELLSPTVRRADGGEYCQSKDGKRGLALVTPHDYLAPLVEITDADAIAKLSGLKRGRGWSWLDIDEILTPFKLNVIVDAIRPGTVVYTEHVGGDRADPVVMTIAKAVKKAGFTVAVFDGRADSVKGHDTIAAVNGLCSCKRCRGLAAFKRGDVAVLVASRTIGEGVDGLQQVGNRVIVNAPPWHDGAWEQLVGRWFRSGQTKNVEVIVPITWMASPSGRVSLDMLRLSRINDRGNIADAVVDGALPTHVGGLGELVAAAKAELEKLG